MQIESKNVFVSGANRGIGKAIVEALLKQKVKKIYAAARKIESLPNFGDARVVPVELDITNPALVKKAAEQAADTDILINNAGVLAYAPVIAGSHDDIKHDMETNYFGTLQVIRAFVPHLEKRGQAAIANVISVVGLASIAGIGGYSASKAALNSATQAMRVELKAKNISVHGIYPGPIDTDMTKDFPMDKANVAETGANIVSGILAGKEDIYPDPWSMEAGQAFAKDPKAFEKQMAGM